MPSSSESSSSPAQADVRTVRVEYYAQLREDAGRSEETVTTEAASVSELFEELDRRHGFSLDPGPLRVAVNAEFADWDTALDAQDLVVFIPPVAGG